MSTVEKKDLLDASLNEAMKKELIRIGRRPFSHDELRTKSNVLRQLVDSTDKDFTVCVLHHCCAHQLDPGIDMPK